MVAAFLAVVALLTVRPPTLRYHGRLAVLAFRHFHPLSSLIYVILTDEYIYVNTLGNPRRDEENGGLSHMLFRYKVFV
jgi:hypothetical protein